MKHSMLIAGILVAAAVTAQARDPKPVDVMIYVKGDNKPPGSVDFGARATVTWMYARIGVRLVWRDGELGSSAASGSPVMIQLRFTEELRGDLSPEALAYALPFGYGRTAITVTYDRISFVACRSSRAQAILAHVLAHEIGHILQRTNGHAETGVMKAHWKGQDYDAMSVKPLEFTSVDVDLIKEGLNGLKARAASLSEKASR